jgi:hypothetical protein
MDPVAPPPAVARADGTFGDDARTRRREATEREVDLEAIFVRQLRELVAAVAARLPAP